MDDVRLTILHFIEDAARRHGWICVYTKLQRVLVYHRVCGVFIKVFAINIKTLEYMYSTCSDLASVNEHIASLVDPAMRTFINHRSGSFSDKIVFVKMHIERPDCDLVADIERLFGENNG